MKPQETLNSKCQTPNTERLFFLIILLSLLMLPVQIFSQTWQEADSLRNVHLGNKNFDNALVYAEKALELVKSEFGETDTLYADMLGGMLYVNYYMGNYEEAIHYGEEEKTIRLLKQEKSHNRYVSCINNLANIYARTGQFIKAQALYQESLDLTEKAFGKEHSEYLSSLYNLAAVYRDNEQHDKALPFFIKALEVTENVYGKEHISYINSLNSLGLQYSNMGQFENALPYNLEALVSSEKIIGKEHPLYLRGLNGLATLYFQMGQYHNALPLALQAIEAAEEVFGNESQYYGSIMNSLAALYAEIGQYDKALPLYQEGLEFVERTMGKEHSHYGIALNNLGFIYGKMGQYEKNLSINLEVLAFREKMHGKEHSLYGTSLNNLAFAYDKTGKQEKALSLYLEAIIITKKSLGQDHPSYSIRLNNLAGLYHRMGQYEEALPLYVEALENAEKNLGKEHSSYGSRLTNLASLFCDLEQYNKALPLYIEAINNNYHNINMNFTFLSEKEKEEFVLTLNNSFFRYQSFFIQYSKVKPEVGGHAYNIALTTKGMILQSGMQMRQAMQNTGDEEVSEKYYQWQNLRSSIAQQYAIPPDKRREDLKEMENNAEKLEGELTRMSSAFNQAQTLTQMRWDDVQKKLNSGQAAIEFAAFNYHSGKELTDSAIYMAIVITPDVEYPIVVPLFEEKELETVLSFQGENNYSYINKIYGKNTEPKTDLYRMIWQPIEQHLNNINTVYISPAGLLHKVSFAAIANEQKQYLSDLYSVNLVSSTALIAKEPREEFVVSNAVLFGGINYNGNYSTSEVWKYLDGSLKEVESIGKTLRKAKPKIFTGKKASETAFKQNAPHSNLIHIATHGFFYPDPIEEEVRLRQNTIMGEVAFRGSSTGFGVLSFVENPRPLMRSGLVFAGANDVWNLENIPDGDDGVLTAQEVAAIDLSNTQLVVLSACETGLGDIRGSEGVYGLQRAFKMAGVKSLIMSLWQVPDKETAEFMEVFYAKLLDYKDVRNAFNETQREMRQKYDPFFWAAFVLVE